ncbi:hypothetical protein [Occultella gossypii]|uniref:Uncharacterized protein n=1 Tax=Occultella gossypii TaxID=2800820 RepID=A0ABS7SGD5_9MICO|nr:hypothetical protein [Occultella gossypii]MBZ2199411.1 hypothetical protein [Occultella gossypii]
MHTVARRKRGRPVAALAAAVAVTLAACDAAGGGDYSVADALARVPAMDVEGLWITTADLDTATTVAGLERPTEPGEVPQWILALTAEADSPAFVPLPEILAQTSPVEESADSFGWSILDVDAFAGGDAAPTDHFATLVGDFDDETLADLPVVEDGIVTVGEGEDFATDLDAATEANPLGVPQRLAESDGEIAVSPSTPLVREWLAGPESSLADDEVLAVLADVLDSADVYSAAFYRGDYSLSADALPPGAEPEVLIREPFETVGMGWASDDDGPLMVVAYAFEDSDSAGAAAEEVRGVWSDGVSLVNAAPWSERVSVEDVVTHGSIVEARLRPVEQAPLSLPMRALQARDLPFQHG